MICCYIIADFQGNNAVKAVGQRLFMRRHANVGTADNPACKIRCQNHTVVDQKLLRQLYGRTSHSQLPRIGQTAGYRRCRRGFGTDQVNIGVGGTAAPLKIAVIGTD